MSYTCKNPDCTAPENKKSKVYPSAMECPFCDEPLVEVISMPESELELIARLPYVIAFPLRRSLVEKHAWTKINLLKDTFLNYLKYLGLITASEFFSSPFQDKKMVTLFYNTLSEPSFGTWNVFIREALKFLNEHNHQFFCPELNAYYGLVETGKKRKLYKGEIEYIDVYGDVQHKNQEATAIGMLINFRNRYLGHGLTLDEATSVKLWEEYYPIFNLLLKEMVFASDYLMYKHEHGETYSLQSAEISQVEALSVGHSSVWLQNKSGNILEILPFFIVPGEVSLAKEDKEQILTYESYTGKTIKFFSPEGTEKQTSGKILERLNILLRNKQQEQPYTPETFTREVFLSRIADENKLIVDTLVAEKKVIPGVYVHRKEMENKLREWVGARASIFIMAAEAGSGKTNLLLEMQKQYADWGLNSLLIRAGRMEKSKLAEQISYLLNIDSTIGLSAYSTIAGTQAAPTFILIDGLNEAYHAEQLWQEVLELSQLFEPGSLKFVVTSRANTAADLDRFPITDNQLNLVYGEKKEQQEGLAAFTFWLTALNMEEMKAAWENYAAKDKSRYKPQFSFDDIATFDRAIYDQINNPLVLRIFLEVYKGKNLPKKGKQHLNIWQDWLQTFTVDEQRFLGLLAAEIWNKGENELLLDDLLNNEALKSYLVSDNLNSPYQRLKNLGWVSRYIKDLNVCIGFTVEGLLLYLFGIQLQNQSTTVDINYIDEILNRNNKLQKSGLESFLSETAMKGDLSLITELIDAGQEYHSTCNSPILLFLRTKGVNAFIDKAFSTTTDYDWQAILMLSKTLDDLQEQMVRKQLLTGLIYFNTLSTKAEVELALKACSIMENKEAQEYLAIIHASSFLFSQDSAVLDNYGDVYQKFGQYEEALDFFQKSLEVQLKTKGADNSNLTYTYTSIGNVRLERGEFNLALECYEKCLNINLKTLGTEHHLLAPTYNNIGAALREKGDYDKALEFFQKCLDIQIKNLGSAHPDIAYSYNNFGNIWYYKGDLNKALEFHHKCLEIEMIFLGDNHPHVAVSMGNIGCILQDKGQYDKALDYFQKGIEIQLKNLGAGHPSVANFYSYIGCVWLDKCEYDHALKFYNKSLDIRLKTFGEEHPDIARLFNNIGLVWKQKGDYNKANVFFQKCLDIQLIALGADHPNVATSYINIGFLHKEKGEHYQTIEYFQKCLDIQLKIFGIEHPDVANSYNNIALEFDNIADYNQALRFYQKALDIQMKTIGSKHHSVATLYFQIGNCYQNIEEFDLAIQAFKNGFSINKRGGYPFRIAYCYEKLNKLNEAFFYFLQSAEIRNADSEAGPTHESTIESIQNTIRLAKLISKENEIPDWMN